MSIAIQFITLMVIFSFIESLWPSSRAHKWWRRPLLVDLCGWLIHPLTFAVGIALASAAVNTFTVTLPPREPWFIITAFREIVKEWPSWAQIVAAFLLADFLSYWIHRAYHHFPALWSFHVVHHTSEELDWLSTSRLHPVSQIVDTAVVAAILLLAGIPVTAVVAANVIIGASALLVHANVRWNFGFLQNLLVSPRFHQWHHASVDENSRDHIGNYGAVLSIWDRVFGTWSLPALKRPERFGVEDGPRATLLGLVLHPLRVCWRLILGPSAPAPRYTPVSSNDTSGISR
jgi:sterol desaturase/sphingolipid hydroxylase (fatty acid hydroxylase superfamily)